jgi:hypothetical protein
LHDGLNSGKGYLLVCVQLLLQLMGVALNDRAVIAMCGIGKMFVGELVEHGK